MKRQSKITIIVLVLVAALAVPVFRPVPKVHAQGIEINATNFPCGNFREFVEQFDNENGISDGFLSQSELDAVTVLDCSKSPGSSIITRITNLKGAEHFTKLKELRCQYNRISDTIDVSPFPDLEYLDCSQNNLSSLDVSKNPKLTTLITANNFAVDRQGIRSLDLRNNPLLTYLDCSWDYVNFLEISNCPALKTLYCTRSVLSSIDLSNNTALEELDITYCFYPIELDLSHNPELKRLGCRECGDTYNGGYMTSLDVSKNTKLVELECGSNQITSLDLSNNKDLEILACEANGIGALDVRHLTKLESLNCSWNPLNVLDVRQNDKLTYLNCSGTELTELNISNNTLIETLDCTYNHLTALDLSAQEALMLNEYGQQLSSTGTQTSSKPLFASLYPDNTYRYDMTELPGVKADKVLTVFNSNTNANLTTNYSATTGVLTLAAAADPGNNPSKLRYDYDTASEFNPGPNELVMDVTLDNIVYGFSILLDPNNGEKKVTGAQVPHADAPDAEHPYTYTLPANTFIAPEGKSFDGWEVNGDKKQPNDVIKTHVHTEVKALWRERASYTVTYADEDGNTISTQTVQEGDAATPPPTVPEKPGYTGEWDYDNEPITGNTTIKPRYTANTYELSFDPAGGVWSDNTDTPKIIEAKTGDEITIPEAPTRDGYDFLHWEGSEYQPGQSFIVPAGGHNFVAEWKKLDTETGEPGESTAPGNDTTQTPTTGDRSGAFFWIGILLVSQGALLFMHIHKKRILKQRD